MMNDDNVFHVNKNDLARSTGCLPMKTKEDQKSADPRSLADDGRLDTALKFCLIVEAM
jgi:hypothetical protein